MNPSENCPCGSKINFSQCCEKYLNGNRKPETAEQLMRSRYSAYVKENELYLRNTWHKDTQPNSIEFDSEIKWLRLSIKNINQGSANDEQGSVEFVATYKINGRAFQLHETSRFIRSRGDWFYQDGEVQNRPAPT